MTSGNHGKAEEVLGKSTGTAFIPMSQGQYSARVDGHQRGHHDGASNASQEEGSLGRDNSEDFIIRKDVQYEVRHE